MTEHPNRLRRIDYKLSEIIANMREIDESLVKTIMYDSNRLNRIEQKVDKIREKVDCDQIKKMADNIAKYGHL